MQLTIDTSQPLSGPEKALLRALLGEDAPKAPKRSPKPSETPPKPATTPPEPDPAPEPTEELDPKLLDEAIELASDLMKQGGAAKVKDALSKVGAVKVTRLDTNDKVRRFVELIRP